MSISWKLFYIILTSPLLTHGTDQGLIPDQVSIMILQDGGEGHGADVLVLLHSVHPNPVKPELVLFVGH